MLLIGCEEIEHFGAVLTLLPDSSLVVLRTVENHPLGLQPGDIVLGYEGVAWKDLVNEFLEADIPLVFFQRSKKSAVRDNEMISAGMNWHLFDTIDIVKYTSGDTVHLSVSPLLDLPVPTGAIWGKFGENLMWNNEQLPVQGVPFLDPDDLDERCLTYGIVEGTNIGYIYLYIEFWEGYEGIDYNFNQQFNEAVISLQETEGLIIDLRLNWGGGVESWDAFSILFNQDLYTVVPAYRCSPTGFNLCQEISLKEYFKINGDPHSLYDRPLAVLVGPNNVSCGELIAHQLRYHPMVHFFGKAACAGLALYQDLESFSDWHIRFSISDFCHLNDPETYLNHSAFPIDVPVWFKLDDVANGEDTVVKRAIEWINNLSHAHDVSADKGYVKPGIDSVLITAMVENPNQHQLSLRTYLQNNSDVLIDSLTLFDDGAHGDSIANDGRWGNYYKPSEEHTFRISVRTEDPFDQTSRTLPNVARFTSAGPIVLKDYNITSSDTLPQAGDELKFEFTLHNDGKTAIAKNVTANLMCLASADSAEPDTVTLHFGDIEPGKSVTSSNEQYIKFSEQLAGLGIVNIPFRFEIASDGYVFWTSDFNITDVETRQENLPTEFALNQNYPNPFNPKTVIRYALPVTCHLDLSIYNILGQKVATLVNQKQLPGSYQVEWDARKVSSGVYYYRLEAEGYSDVKKMVVIK